MSQLEPPAAYPEHTTRAYMRAAPTSLSPQASILIVLEVIAASGPITKSKMIRTLAMSEQATSRAIDVLQRQNWVRRRIGDGAFELCEKIDRCFLKAHVAPPEAQDFDPVIRAVAASGKMSATVGLFQEPGKFAAVEATTARTDFGNARSLVIDDLALAAQSILSEASLNQHIARFFRTYATKEDTRLYDQAGHAKRLLRLLNDGMVWLPAHAGFTVPLHFSTGGLGAIRFEALSPNGIEPHFLREFANRLKGARTRPDRGINAAGILPLLKISLEFDDLMHDPREA